ncbi:hypothetical protein ACOME3_007277 [Neoechinorhynchus agilis]
MGIVDVFDFQKMRNVRHNVERDVDAKLNALWIFDEGTLFLVGNDCIVRTLKFDENTFSRPAISRQPFTSSLLCVSGLDKSTAVVGSASGAVYVLHVCSLLVNMEIDEREHGAVCCIATKSQLIVCGHDSGSIVCSEISKNNIHSTKWIIHPHQSSVTGITFKDANKIVSISTDQRVKEYQMDDNDCPKILSTRITDVADVQGLSIYENNLLIYGLGVEIFNENNDQS